MEVARLYVAIPVHNRRAVVEQCVPTIYRSIERPSDRLFLYDDGSTEYNIGSLDVGQDYSIRTESMGVDAQRRRHFVDFWDHAHRPYSGDGPSFSHLYLTDGDAPHDPGFRAAALALQAEHNLPICLYNTATHENMPGNTFRDTPGSNVILRRFAPGVSYLLTLEHVAKIMPHIDTLQSWDWQVPSLLGYRMAVSRTSYVEHIGAGGQHDPADGSIGPERALNPTPWLVKKRAEIIAKLEAPRPSQ